MKMKTIYRKEYMEKLENLKDKKIIKVLTGIRRCGKSTILNEFRKKLISEGVSEKNIISINFDDNSYNNLLDSNTLHEYIMQKVDPKNMNYILLDAHYNKSIINRFIYSRD